MMNRLIFTDDPGQRYSFVMGDRKVTISFRYNLAIERFTFSLSIDEVEVLAGRRLVTNVDLLKPFSFGVGALVAYDPDGRSREATLENLVRGDVRVAHVAP